MSNKKSGYTKEEWQELEGSQRISGHIRYVHDTMEDADIQTVLGLLDSWASEVKHLEDSLIRCERAVYNLGGNLDESIR